MCDGVELLERLDEGTIRNIPYEEYRKSLHCSKNYYNTLRRFKHKNIPQLPLHDAINFLLTSEKIPAQERQEIKRITVYRDDKIIALHCTWASTIFEMRDQIYHEIGWYPYVTGLLLEESPYSKKNNEWLGDRNFNMYEFPNFPINNIKLQNVAKNDGIAFMLHLEDFKILLDCCFNLYYPNNFELDDVPDLIFISHAHNDHFGSLEEYLARYDGIPLIMSYTTLDLITYYKRKSSSLIEYLKKNAYPLLFDDIYSLNDALSLQSLKAGHYPGAAMLSISTPQYKILYTGDTFLHDLQPLKGSGSGIHNLNGPLNTIILDGQFSNRYISSQKLLLDRACAKAAIALQSGGPVVVFGDPGSWLLILYLKFFYYFSQIHKKYRIYLDSHTIEIMKMLRYRQEDITPFLAQRILHFHDPFASIMRQDLATLDFKTHSIDDPPIILFNARNYTDPPPSYLTNVFDNPNALVIISFPIRSEPLRALWDNLTYNYASPKPLQCTLFDHSGNPRDPRFSSHIDRSQILEIFRHLTPAQVILFHNSHEYLTSFNDYFYERLSWLYPDTNIHILENNGPLLLYDASLEQSPSIETEYYFFPLIKTLELAQKEGHNSVGLSILAPMLTSKFPYWKEQTGVSKVSDYISEASSAEIIEVNRSKSEILVKLKS